MVERYGLNGTMDRVAVSAPDWNPVRSLDLARIRGEPVSRAEERRRMLLAAPVSLAFDELAREVDVVDREAAESVLAGAKALQALTAAQVEELSRELGRRTASVAGRRAAARSLVLEVLRERGFLPRAGGPRVIALAGAG
jgi:hypothetical protein